MKCQEIFVVDVAVVIKVHIEFPRNSFLYVFLSFQDNIFPLLNDAGAVMVRHSNTYSLVIVNCHQQLECRSCRHKYTCQHIKALNKSMESGNPELVEFAEVLHHHGSRMVNVPVLVSAKKISFIGHTTEIPADGQFTPDENGQCEHGHNWASGNPIANKWVDKKCPLFAETSIAEACIYYRPCSNTSCSERKFYDGNQAGILHMSQFLVTHAVLRAYMRMFLICGYVFVPLYGYFF